MQIEQFRGSAPLPTTVCEGIEDPIVLGLVRVAYLGGRGDSWHGRLDVTLGAHAGFVGRQGRLANGRSGQPVD